MLDYFAVFTRGGALLWTLQFAALGTTKASSPVDALNALVRGCLLEGRSGDAAFTYAPKPGAPPQALKWAFHNGLGLVFVAVYQQALSLTYVEELLARVRDAFAAEYAPGAYAFDGFAPRFQKILRDVEARADAARRGAVAAAPKEAAAPPPKPAAVAAAAAAVAKQGGGGGGAAGATPPRSDNGNAARGSVGPSSVADSGADDGDDSDAGAAAAAAAEANGGGGGFDVAKLRSLSRKAGGGPPGRRNLAVAASRGAAGAAAPAAAAAAAPKKAGSQGKQARVWGQLGRRDEEPGRIDYTEGAPAAAGAGAPATSEQLGASRMDEEEDYGSSDDDDEDSLRAAAGQRASSSGAAKAGGKAAAGGVLGSFMAKVALRVVGSAALTREDLAPALDDMKRKLMERNVAEEIAGQVVGSVARSLEGQKLSSLTGVSRFVRRAFEEALSGILNKRQVDVLHDIKRARDKGRPYVVVFCGVNGVGKSTNLAKIAYWLGAQGCRVQLAACDTFRAGAVEQLKTHAVRLGVPLYERGYEKDPAKVASEAIRAAQRDGRDVVLVDTAGRMQDNEPLMRALSNLIAVNAPDLVLFVGEALVGNDAVDQLVKFNRSLADLAPGGAASAAGGGGKRQVIDGIVLTKFDTIDDKVGAALSMVYASGAPVMFVGCGQTYVDLKRLNVKAVVASLLK